MDGANELIEDAEEYFSLSCFLIVIDTAKHLSNEASNPGDSKWNIWFIIYYELNIVNRNDIKYLNLAPEGDLEELFYLRDWKYK